MATTPAMTANEPTEARRAAASFHALGPASAVWLCADACLELRPARSACRKCRDVCPVDAFEWTADGVSLHAGCTACGMCAAACPSGALHVAGFERARLTSPARRIECSRVPSRIAGDAARAPCLGGISAITVLELAAGSSTPWRLVDRGWCAGCPVGDGGAAALAATLESAGALFDAVGVPRERLPALVREPLPAGTALPVQSTADAARVRRRGFFGALARTAQQATVRRMPLGADRHGRLPSRVIQAHRQRLAAALQALADDTGRTVPASLFPAIEVAAQCDQQGPCAALCPSGALRRDADGRDGTLSLQFDALMCVACGLCERHCPSAALRLLPSGDGNAVAAPGPRTLSQRTRRVCCECAAAYVDAGSSAVCPQCAIDRSLAASIFGTKLADKADDRPEIEMRSLQQPVP